MDSSLDAAALLAPTAVVEVYKTDRRSTVWRVETPGGPMVVKRFEYNPMRQLFTRLLGLHPAQREQRMNHRLVQLGLPVVPIVAAGWLRSGAGCKGWIATPHRGVPLHRWVGLPGITPRQKCDVAKALGRLTGGLLAAHLLNGDHKASNHVVDERGRVWLIDTGGVVRAVSMPTRLPRMLAVLDITARRGGAVSRTDRLRFLRAVVDACPGVGSVRDVLALFLHAGLARVLSDPRFLEDV